MENNTKVIIFQTAACAQMLQSSLLQRSKSGQQVCLLQGIRTASKIYNKNLAQEACGA